MVGGVLRTGDSTAFLPIIHRSRNLINCHLTKTHRIQLCNEWEFYLRLHCLFPLSVLFDGFRYARQVPRPINTPKRTDPEID